MRDPALDPEHVVRDRPRQPRRVGPIAVHDRRQADALRRSVPGGLPRAVGVLRLHRGTFADPVVVDADGNVARCHRGRRGGSRGGSGRRAWPVGPVVLRRELCLDAERDQGFLRALIRRRSDQRPDPIRQGLDRRAWSARIQDRAAQLGGPRRRRQHARPARRVQRGATALHQAIADHHAVDVAADVRAARPGTGCCAHRSAGPFAGHGASRPRRMARHRHGVEVQLGQRRSRARRDPDQERHVRRSRDHDLRPGQRRALLAVRRARRHRRRGRLHLGLLERDPHAPLLREQAQHDRRRRRAVRGRRQDPHHRDRSGRRRIG